MKKGSHVSKSPRQTLPLRGKVLPDPDLSSRGKTDEFFRFSDRKKLGEFVVRQNNVPGGEIYKDALTREKVTMRKRELARYAQAASSHGISVVPHIDLEARMNVGSTPSIYTLARRIDGPTILDLLKDGNLPEAIKLQQRVISATIDYCVESSKSESAEVISDIVKPSQFILASDGSLVMVDVNPPLWSGDNGVDSNMVEVLIQMAGLTLLGSDGSSIDHLMDGSEKIGWQKLPETFRCLTNQVESSQLPLGHPQRVMLENVAMDMLMERPILGINLG